MTAASRPRPRVARRMRALINVRTGVPPVSIFRFFALLSSQRQAGSLSYVKRPFCAEFSGEAQSRFEQIGGDDPGAGELEQPGEHEANRPLPGHEHDVATQQGQSADGFEDGVDGFEHGAFGKGIPGGNFHDAGQDERHDADVFGVTAAGGLEAGGDAGAFVSLALGEGVMPAKMAVQARDVMVQGDAVANLPSQTRDSRPQL